MSEPANSNRFPVKPEPTAFRREEAAEDAAIRKSNRFLYNAQTRHPVWFTIVVFILGGIITSFFTVSSFKNWGFEGIDLVTALTHVLFLPIAGGVLLVILATIAARSMRP